MVPPFQGCWNTATNPGDFGRLRCRGIDIDHGPAPVVPVLVFNRRNAMALNLTQKKEVVAELAGVAGKAVSLVAAEYAGLNVGTLTDIGTKARDSGENGRALGGERVWQCVEIWGGAGSLKK